MKQWKLIAASLLLLSMQSVPAKYINKHAVKPHKVIIYTSPLDIPLIVSGSFGELRPNHFHSGIDFKTNGKTGFPVHSIAPGYVSKIFVSLGSGYMLHITHPTGYTSIYRHMIGFAPKIMQYTLRYQYKHQVDQCEIDLKPGELKVEQGEVIGLSGNEGFSEGPHVHLDMYRTDNGDFIDPLPFFRRYLKDTRRPQADGIRLFAQPGEGIVAGRTDQLSFYPANGKIIQGWGSIGVGVKSHDYQDASFNRLRVRYIQLFVDGKLKCYINMGCFSRTEEKQVSAWVTDDFEKLYREPANHMRIMSTDKQHGLIVVNQERDYKCELVLRDLFGNESRYNFIIRGRKKTIPPKKLQGNEQLYWNKINVIKRPGMQLTVPCSMVPNNLGIHVGVHASKGLSDVYQLDNQLTPLLGSCELQIRLLRAVPKSDIHKLYIAQQKYGLWKYCGGVYRNGYIVTKIDKLGTYCVMMDKTAPHIAVVSSGRGGKLSFVVTDTGSDLQSYRGYVDGKFVLLHLRRQSDKMEYKLDPAYIKRGGTHSFELIAVDNVGNVATYKNTFKW